MRYSCTHMATVGVKGLISFRVTLCAVSRPFPVIPCSARNICHSSVRLVITPSPSHLGDI